MTVRQTRVRIKDRAYYRDGGRIVDYLPWLAGAEGTVVGGDADGNVLVEVDSADLERRLGDAVSPAMPAPYAPECVERVES